MLCVVTQSIFALKKADATACTVSGKMKSVTMIFVVAFLYAESKEKPRAWRGEDCRKPFNIVSVQKTHHNQSRLHYE